ncbi:MAG TPA: hypothetical protein VEL74_09870 [Thermoanaerobaculia bacterium]|nr:hypothetical protein [Thermoanaerobaculia bacterium]
MEKRPSLGNLWKVVVTVLTVATTLMALYVQLFERRSRQEEDRLAAVRLEAALAESRARLKTEILAELRAELARAAAEQPDGQPRPDTVLRRPESDGNGPLQQAPLGLPSGRSSERLDSLARQMEDSDRALRQDLEELRAASRREAEISSRATSLILLALVLLAAHLLVSLWRPRQRGQGTAPRPEG